MSKTNKSLPRLGNNKTGPGRIAKHGTPNPVTYPAYKATKHPHTKAAGK